MQIEQRIDDLYRGPLESFTESRAVLATELKGDDQRRVKALKKPTIVPWAVNQVYWHARSAFDRVLKSGAALRRAQLGVLEGKPGDVRAANQQQRESVSAAVSKAIELAEAAGVHPDRDALTQTFEGLSLASEPPEPPGRLTKPLRPGGFEMLTGAKVRGVRLQADPERKVKPKSGVVQAFRLGDKSRGVRLQADQERRRARKREEAAARKRARQEAAEQKRRAAAIKKAEAVLALAQAQEANAERAWREAQEAVVKAKHALHVLR